MKNKYISIKINNISFDMEGQKVSVSGKVTDIYKTSGPLVFRIYDGNEIRAVVFNPDENFYSLKLGDYIRFNGTLSVRRENVELQIDDFEKLNQEEINTVQKRIDKNILDKIKRDTEDFLVSSKIYKNMEDEFLQAMASIKKAVLEERLIFIRHHNDCDGIVSGIALEKAIAAYAEKENKKDLKIFRKPCFPPYYGIEDALKDIETSFNFSKKRPFVIIVDNGSTVSDLEGIFRTTIYDFEIGVIDHHPPSKNHDGNYIIDEYVSFHINPHIYSGDSNICTGMLAYELARMIDSDLDNYAMHLPALAGVGDKSKGSEMELYLEISPIKREELEDIKLTLDHESYYLRRSSFNEIIEDILMIGDGKRGKLLRESVISEIEKKRVSQWELIKKHLVLKKLNSDFNLLEINIDKFIFRGDFPSPGRTLGFIHNKYLEENKLNEDEVAIVSLGFAEDYLVIRATNRAKSIGFDLNMILKQLKDIYLEEVQGGGHAGAGTIRFVPALYDEVKKVSLDYIDMVAEKK